MLPTHSASCSQIKKKASPVRLVPIAMIESLSQKYLVKFPIVIVLFSTFKKSSQHGRESQIKS